MQRAFTSFLFSTLPIATLGCLIPLATKAQVTPDGTTSTTVNQDGDNFTIEQGDRSGNNLFHSFDEFSVPTLGSAVFNNAGDITNIFSRVTGSSISNIDGLLGANGTANLYLINPNGIIFGENARLDLGGSFFASTADSLLFEGDTEFSAVNPQAAPLLEVSIPIGASFRDNPGNIVNRSRVTADGGFFVRPEKTLSLIGGNVILENGQAASLGGNIELGGLAIAGTITFNDDLSLSFPDNLTKADVLLENNAFVGVNFGNGGNININARNFELNQSAIRAGIGENQGTLQTQAGDININASNEIRLNQESTISNQVFDNATGNAGDISINTNSLILEERSNIGANTFGNGNSGNININAVNLISFTGESRLTNQVFDNATGNAGDININTNDLIITDGSDIGGTTFGNGNGSNININATDNISISGFETFASGIYSNVGSETAVGNSGNIQINASNFDISNGGVVNAITFGKGNGGTISITAAETISIDGETENTFQNRGIASGVQSTGIGNAGNINLQANSLDIQNGGSISSSTFGTGDAGNITLDVADSISLLNGANIQSSIGSQTTGNSAGIKIDTKNLSLNGSLIGTLLEGRGNTEAISINVLDSVSLDNRGVIANGITLNGVGNSAGIKIDTKNLSLNGSSQIDTSILGTGVTDGIEISASENISIDGIESLIFSEIDDVGEGNSGSIRITATNLSLRNGGGINSNSTGNGNSGAISLNISDTIAVGSNSGIFNAVSETSDGNSEGINITTNNLFLNNGGQINSNSFGTGDAGDINIQAKKLSLENRGLISSNTNIKGNGGNISIEIDGSIEISSFNPEINDFSQISTETFGEGNGGNIEVFARSLFLDDGGEINSSTSGKGNGGNIDINIAERITLGSPEQSEFISRIVASSFGASGNIVDRLESGDAGKINIKGKSLSLNNGSIISSVSVSVSPAKPGDILIDVNENITFSGESQNGSGSSISTNTLGTGEGGNIELLGQSLFLGNGAEITSSSDLLGSANGGSVIIKINDDIILSGQSKNGDFTNITTDTSGDGSGGNIQLQASSLTLENGAGINSNVNTGLNMENASVGEGGNIDLEISDILLFRNNGLISARASDNANGGNVTINADDGLILAFPNQNNDIIANASEGRGGNINIDTQAIFGLEERFSTPPNQTNDIDASSEFGLQGDFSLNTPDFDPTTGLINLPASVGDASDRISQNPCQQGVGSEFIVTGKGGLSPTVNEALNAEEAQVRLIEPLSKQKLENGETGKRGDEETPEVLPAMGWVFNDKGEVTLTAYRTSDTEIKRSPQQISNVCSASSVQNR